MGTANLDGICVLNLGSLGSIRGFSQQEAGVFISHCWCLPRAHNYSPTHMPLGGCNVYSTSLGDAAPTCVNRFVDKMRYCSGRWDGILPCGDPSTHLCTIWQSAGIWTELPAFRTI